MQQSGIMGKKVVVGMSGGVDSSVAAYLLKEQGYEVIGVTMETWGRSGGGCLKAGETAAAAEDAAKVAEALGIPHYVMDFREDFRRFVMDYFVEEYLQGRTPNPCIVCNRRVKWGALLERALELGAEYIATGHYARIARLPNGRLAIRRSVTEGKDQSYALYSLSQEQLAHTLLPVGDYEKDRIRTLAGEAGLPVAEKPDSQEICFVPDGDYAGFIRTEAGERVPGPGRFVYGDGREAGDHEGITHYTIGQRRGLKLPLGERIYVTDIRPETNEVVIGRNEELFTDRVICGGINYMGAEELGGNRRVLAKIRYNHRGEYCRIEKLPGDRVLAVFEHPVRAAAPGQSMCFYDGEYVLGGGIILKEEVSD